MWRVLDTLVHRLSWVVPHALYRWVCGRYEARLQAPVADWVDDPALTLEEVQRRLAELEPTEVVSAAFDASEKGVTRAPESVRREVAQRHRDDIDIDSAEAVAPWRPRRRTVGYRCQHMNITIGGLAHMTGPVTAWCGCRMEPVYAA